MLHGMPSLFNQGADNSGKHGNLREFVNSGKLRNLKYAQGILVLQMLFFHDTICNTQQADM